MPEDMFTPLPGADRRDHSRRPAARVDWRPVVPVPEDAPPPPDSHPQAGHPTKIWTYRDQDGALLGYVWRLENESSGRKFFLPLTWCKPPNGGPGLWRFRSWETPRPLYGLDRLTSHDDDAPVIVTEGEKAADSVEVLLHEFPALTSPNGALSAAKADWRPLSRRSVVVWPDADPEGLRYAAEVGAALEAVGADVSVIDPPPGVAEGWDADDARAEGWHEAETLALVEEARPLAEWRAAHPLGLNRSNENELAGSGSGRNSRPLSRDPSDGCLLTPLGHRDGVYYFLSPAGEVRRIAGDKMNARAISSLVDGEVTWFSKCFNSNARAGFDDYAAADYLRRVCREAGFFDPETPQRGPGVWRVGNDLVVHAGDALLINKKWQRAGIVRGGAIYPASAPIPRPSENPATKEVGRHLLDTLKRWTFSLEIGPELIVGFIGEALLCGAIPWRAHVAVQGQGGTGKTLLTELIAAALGGAAHEVSSDFTEAGLRQSLTGQARAILLDEAEQSEGSLTVVGVIRLLRLMSSRDGALVRRGTAGGSAQLFRVNGVAFLAAVLLPNLAPQDRSRITCLDLGPLDPAVSTSETGAAIDKLRAASPALWARAIHEWRRFLETFEAYRAGLIQRGCTARTADQLATLAAGRDLLLHDDVPQADGLAHEIERLAPLIAAGQTESTEGEGINCWTHLITSPVDPSHRDEGRTVGELLQRALKPEGTTARKILEAIGIKIVNDVPNQLVLVSNNHNALARIFKDTHWASGEWVTALRYLPGARAYPNEKAKESVPRFGASRQRATAIPAELVAGDEAD